MNLEDMRSGNKSAEGALRSVMGAVMTGAQQPVSEQPQSSLQQHDENSVTETSAPIIPAGIKDAAFAEIEKTDWFKSLSQEEKDAVRGGIHPDKKMGELDAAVAEQEQELLATYINPAQENAGQAPVSPEEFRSENFAQTAKPAVGEEDGDETEAELRKLLKEAEGSDAEDLSEEDSQLKAMREIEKHLAEGLEVYTEGYVDTFNPSHAVTDVRISRNKDYEEAVKNALDMSDISFKTTKKGNLKKALLKNFIQKSNHVTTPLINSGIFITLSGASVPEIIQMSTLEARSRAEQELKKFGFVLKHLVNTSVGNNISLTDFMKLIHLQDVSTIWFNLFFGTFPDPVDYPIHCENKKCETALNLKLNAPDLVLNYDEFSEASNYILYQNEDIKDVLGKSSLSKEKLVQLGNKMVVSIKNPSVYDSVHVTTKIEFLANKKKKDLRDYQGVIGYLMFVQFVALPTPDGEYMKFTEADEILEILSVMDENTQTELDTHIEEFVQKNSVKYGIKEFVCPNCKHVHKERVINIDELLFTLSQIRWMMKNLERYNRKEEMKKLNESEKQ